MVKKQQKSSVPVIEMYPFRQGMGRVRDRYV